MSYKKILLAINTYEKADIVINSAIYFAKKNNIDVLNIVTVIDFSSPFAPSIVNFQHSMEHEAKKALKDN